MNTNDPQLPSKTAPESKSGRRRIFFARWSIGPFIATAICLGVWTVTLNPPRFGYLALTAGLGFVGGVFYFFVQFIGRLLYQQWWGAFLAIVRVVICLVAFGKAFFFAVFVMGDMADLDDADHFADKLTIPANIEISKPIPVPAPDQSFRGKEDAFQQALMASLKNPAGPKASVVPSVPSLREMIANHKPLLMRYLESSPAWRVHDERGGLYATRRWEFGTRWISSMNGYYSQADPFPFGIKDEPKIAFQNRMNLDLTGKVLIPTQNANWMEEGTTPYPVLLKPDNEMDSSITLIRCGGDVVLELFDQSPGPGRRLTDAALMQLESECKEMLSHPEFDLALLPAGSIQHGSPSLKLYESGIDSGNYDTEAWVNPGEPGVVYLKAYEVTHNTPLSIDELYKSSNERMGWSSDPRELFLTATFNVIYEGDPGHRYAARFELWFKPDSRGPERELVMRNFIIEGYKM